MITAVDTNILLDVFSADKKFGHRSREALRQCTREGQIVACEVVWAETAVFFPSFEIFTRAMDRLGIGFSSIDERTALAAAAAWKIYRARGGRRERVVADFLIGAHAIALAEKLLTRDRGFYRSYFSGLKIADPTGRPTPVEE
ncbi:MAG: type II toxin-antitoxin system VapC family toxin [Deltaproteobacteria bacterium]|nr:type II toxin-antitoxin system VapC family toxin [Deltaproteobacteria bacterium]